ncbi:hypothetical protein NDU88_004876 [Pleurodeles waltl]|uniref:Uncharacterized protein n=1 Tax=Pleurodeles waltl TaxID=8319 RepID=A0AAV7NKT6_PLEWA|nr:hypothetical protein NDU88_004876 [Pleurodeles waltl]
MLVTAVYLSRTPGSLWPDWPSWEGELCNRYPVTGLIPTAIVAGLHSDGFTEKCPGGTLTEGDPTEAEYFRGQDFKGEEDREEEEDAERNEDREEVGEVMTERSHERRRGQRETRDQRQRCTRSNVERSPPREYHALFLEECGSTRYGLI